MAGWALFGGTFLVQAAFPFTNGGTYLLTVASVTLLAATALVHAAASRGARTAVALAVIAGGGGLIAESAGVHTGFPFGSYDYTGSLGLELAGVPVLVPLAWIMMAWPAFLVARRLTGSRPRWVTAALGAFALTAWDVFLDPQMVDQGHWRWADPTPALPGVEGIPVTNFAGWLLVSLLMMVALSLVVGGSSDASVTDLLPLTVYLWTYVSSVVAHAVFFGRPPVALVGGIIMGLVAIPLALSLFRESRRATR